MIERPDVAEELIEAAIQAEYGLNLRGLRFLPLGYDVNTAVYQAETRDEAELFVKLRMGKLNPVAVEIPHFLSSQGIQAVIAPLKTSRGQFFGRCGEHSIILYPYIRGNDGYEVSLTTHQWISLGKALKSVHSTVIPPHLAAVIPTEVYNPRWRESVKGFQQSVAQQSYNEPVAQKLAVFMQKHRHEISHLVERAEALADFLRQSSLPMVLCHSDAHPGNFLVAETGELYLVDWDNPVFAPKELDLMCFGGGMAGDFPGSPQETSFYQGYGSESVDQHALAYYRFERIIQDIAEFCKRLLLSDEGGADREGSYEFLASSFLPGQVVEAALETDRRIA